MSCCLVALLSPPYATLTYAVPEWLPASGIRPGLRVAAPLGRGMRSGVVLQRLDAPPPDAPALKPLLWPMEREPLLSEAYLEMMRQLALRHMTYPGRILGSALPAGLRSLRFQMRSYADAAPRAFQLQEVAALSPADRARLGLLWEQGGVEYLGRAQEAADREICAIRSDPPWPVRPSAKRQLELLEYLWENGAMSRRALCAALGQTALAALRALAKRNLVAISSYEAFSPASARETAPATAPPPDFALTPDQERAVARLDAALGSGKPASALLFGVTGSGKTVVYLELAKRCLALGRSVVLLAPEVALAHKLRREALHALPGARLFFSHGYQPPAQRETVFRELAFASARNAEPCVVVGTRSALFLPVPRLGAVILDEEHDSSFKQDEGLNYQAKEIAHYRVSQERGVLVLGSATPDVRTFYAAHNQALPLLALGSRVGAAALPELELIDIRDQGPEDGLLAPQACTALQETIRRGEQAVILLNRRGYAPLMYCLDCGTVARCPHCDIGLTYHKGRERLVCHYCGYTRPFPSPCVQCKGLHYLPMGEGTEKLEETLSSLLGADARALRLDRDTTRRPGSMEEILEAFARKEAQVLVGTQMLSKGHHFPDVTLVVVADADLGLNLPDYRATERTFQLLVQSAGRAGRGDKPGRVLVQTRDVGHFCWSFVRDNNYVGFYEREIELRRKRRYPPFVKLGLIRFSFPLSWDRGPHLLGVLAQSLRAQARTEEVVVLGPAPAPLALLRGRKRFQCLLKADDWMKIRAVYAKLVADAPRAGEMRISLDIDPVNMM